MNQEWKEAKVDIPVDKFQYLARQMKELLITDTEAEQQDLSQILWEVLADKCDHNELNNIGIVGEVRKGKSTIAIFIAWWITRYYDKKLGRPPTDIGGLIFSDQTEFLRFIKQQRMYVGVCIDEFNTLADTGLNATTEAALFDYYSNVFAGMYVNRIACSPAILLDKNTTVVLTVLGKNDEAKITRVRITYRDPVDKTTQIIGHADIHVGELLEDPFYKKYLKKKYLRMRLVSKAGIRDIRDLEFGMVTTNAWNKLASIVSTMNTSRELIAGFVNNLLRKEGFIYSELAKNEITNRTASIAGLVKELQKIKKASTKKGADKHTLDNNARIIANVLQAQIDEEARLKHLYEHYLKITGEEEETNIDEFVAHGGNTEWELQDKVQRASNAERPHKRPTNKHSSSPWPNTQEHTTQTSSTNTNGRSSHKQKKQSKTTSNTKKTKR